MKAYILSFILSSSVILKAQSNHFSLLMGCGASYFLNDKTLNQYLDNCKMIGFNYVINNKNQRILFSPGIYYQSNAYHSKFEGDHLVHVNQDVFNFNLDVLMKIAKTKYLRVGLFLNRLDYSNVFISEAGLNSKNYYTYNAYGVDRNYFSPKYQAGVTIGLSFPFELFKREQKFDIKLSQIASPIVNTDFNLTKAEVGEDLKVLSVKGRPTMLILALEFNLRRIKKKKEKDEE
jgi:hypothetical protein